MSHLIKSDLSGSTVSPQAFGFQKLGIKNGPEFNYGSKSKKKKKNDQNPKMDQKSKKWT